MHDQDAVVVPVYDAIVVSVPDAVVMPDQDADVILLLDAVVMCVPGADCVISEAVVMPVQDAIPMLSSATLDLFPLCFFVLLFVSIICCLCYYVSSLAFVCTTIIESK